VSASERELAACEFTKEELELLASGFAFFVQEFEFGMSDDNPARDLERKLWHLCEVADYPSE
jgi:hypothetical protein